MMRWFDRSFTLGMGNELLPMILERLRGTPVRLELLVHTLAEESLKAAPDGGWSAQTNVGHLVDLEPLWYGRLEDLAGTAEELRPADLTNRKTREADHDGRPIDDLLAEFRSERGRLVWRAQTLRPEELEGTALHPRLLQPMSMADLLFFIAEHDDHHLARIRDLGRPEREVGT